MLTVANCVRAGGRG